MKKYRYILFDLDGTLIYSHPGIYSCFQHALKAMGKPEAAQDVLRKCIGPSLMYSFATFFDMTEEDARKATALYREQYSVTGVYENAPIEGALECLKDLKSKGYVMALATSKPKIYADIIAERWGFSVYLQEQVGPGMDGSLDSKAEVIAEAIRLLGANKEECLMIGDRHHDIEGAKENGIDSVLLKVGYAAEGEEMECQPTYVVEDFAALETFLTK
ncbi:MAG: HAD family hydrolase [Clostridiales bacterium]|nr:HAD family hydrolase [Clostridiales bacterium]